MTSGNEILNEAIRKLQEQSRINTQDDWAKLIPNNIDIQENTLRQIRKTVQPLQQDVESLKKGMAGFPQVQELQEKIKELGNLIKTQKALETQLSDATELIGSARETANKIKEEAESTNRVKLDTELGASFKNRKEALISERKNMRCFLYATLLGTLCIAVYSFYINLHNITSNLDSPTNYLSLLYSAAVIYAPLFLITWFIVRYFTRRVNEYDHLIEEYANKEALSLSFARYKETFKEIAGETQKWDALEKFTDATANELIKNPTHIFPKNKADKLPIKEFKEIFKIWNVLPDSNQTMIIEVIKNIVEQRADIEIEKEKIKMQKRAENSAPPSHNQNTMLNKRTYNDPFGFEPEEEDVPF